MKCKNPECNNDTELRTRGNLYKAYCSEICKVTCSHKNSVISRINNRSSDFMGSGICGRKGCFNATYITKKGKYSIYCSSECKKLGVNEEIKKSNLKRYGVENVSQLDSVKQKTKLTFDERYNGHPMLTESIRDKIKHTNLDRYNVECVLSLPVVKDKIKKTNLEKYGVLNPSQKHISQESLYILDSRDEMEKLFSTNSITRISEILGVTIRTVKLRLVDHGIYTVKNSTFEAQIIHFLKEHNIDLILNSRSIISPYEIDIFIKSANLGIECNGSYWHSELQGKNKNYHLDKTLISKEKNIELLHIREDEWETKSNIVKSIILSKLGKLERIYARNCIISIIPANVEQEFLNSNHIQGYIPSNICYGLYHNNILVSLMSFGKPRYSKYEFELLRFANKLNISVVGGASKIFSNFKKYSNPTSIISYSHKDKFTGSLYRNLGFIYSHSSQPSYSYTRDYIIFNNRLKYQKHKLEKLLPIFNKDRTEWENMQDNGYDRIWDCGNDVWLWKNNDK